jgi:hypothetical protein
MERVIADRITFQVPILCEVILIGQQEARKD